MTTSSQPQYRFRVAICGCGIGGLGLAVMLSKYAPDIKVDIYEASTNPGEIGLGIAVTWRTSKIMDELGLRDDFESIGSPLDFSKLPKMALSKEDQEHGNPIPKNNKPEVRLVTLHRARLYSILFSRLGPNCTMHMSKRVVSYVQPGDANEPVTLLFADGHKETCDVLIGGDGIKSRVRATMVEELALLADAEGDAKGAASWRGFAKPSYTGILMYRMMYPGAKLEELSPNHPTLSDLTVFTGKGAGLVTYMVKLPAGRFGYMAVYSVKPELEGTPYSEPWITEGDAQEVVDCVAGWSQNAQDLGACVEGSVKKWAIHVVRGLPTFSYGRVAVIGDAAHSMTPFLGSGAGQALEDAYCLAKLFAHPSATRSTISQALKSYTQIRQPIAQQFVENSRQLGLLWTQSADKEYTLDELGAQCDAVTDIVAKGSPLEDAEKAVALFSTLIA